MLKGLIFGMLGRFWNQNTFIVDYQFYARKFLGALIEQGYEFEKIASLFREAACRLTNKEWREKKKKTEKKEDLVFFHS